MTNFNVREENVNDEILARIVKSTARKYDCSMKIDFSDGNRVSNFVGDNELIKPIAQEVQNLFSKK